MRQREPAQPAIPVIAQAVTAACGVKPEALGAGGRLDHRLLFSHLARRHRHSWRAIAEILKATPMTARLQALACADRLKEDEKLRRQLKQAEELL